MTRQPNLLLAPETVYMQGEQIFHKNIIEDRGSKYSVLCAAMDEVKDPKKRAKLFSHGLRKEKFFKNATHNSYAWRYEDEDGCILEGYFDDGEKGAGLCILREMRKSCILNGLIVVTRYYGGIKLEGDRFRHVIDATKFVIGEIER